MQLSNILLRKSSGTCWMNLAKIMLSEIKQDIKINIMHLYEAPKLGNLTKAEIYLQNDKGVKGGRNRDLLFTGLFPSGDDKNVLETAVVE